MTVADIAHCLDLNGFDSDETVLRDAIIDSRQVSLGSLFVCLPGQHVDGHDYALAAVQKGASAILCARPLPCITVPCLQVPDPALALQKLAAYWRQKTRARVIGITGTAGKTTLKEAIAVIFTSAGKKIAISEKNHNNQLGLSCSILAASGQEDYWIMEIGISHEHDMDELGSMLRPDLALILNIGSGHSEGLGKKGVAWHKARLLNYLAAAGHALVSADYPALVENCLVYTDRIDFFSSGNNSAASYKVVNAQPLAGKYMLDLAGQPCEAHTPFTGAYGAELAIAAAACANLCKIGCRDLNAGFLAFHQQPGRFHIEKIGPWQIIDDTYNANPLSMSKMLESAKMLAQNQPLYVCLGQMGELGNEAQARHQELGHLLRELQPNLFFWKGDYLEDLKKGYGAGGNVRPVQVESPEIFYEELAKLGEIQPGVIIFKGSRSNRLENYLEVFKKYLSNHVL